MKRPNENTLDKGKKFKSTDIDDDNQLGTILSVSLQNFMCHDNLSFDFHPHINFIIGQNGSGKSAILTGIILALGGKSSVTGRYSNIKGFVKTGKNKARVSVTLKNCGPHAYKHEHYGDKIIVEREINIEGVSSYKLKDGSGKIVSQLKDELINILIAMDIQIDNPVLVLTQETSRNFLMAKTGREEKLYEFFYKGTGLQKLEDDYQLSVATNEDCANDLAAKKQALDVMEKEVKRLAKLRESDEKLDELKRESFWARISLVEKQIDDKKKTKVKLLKYIEVTKEEAEKSKNRHNEETLKLEKFQQDRSEIEKKNEIERRSYSEFSVKAEMCADNVRKCQGLVDRYKREAKKLLEDIHDAEETISECQMKNQTDYENEKNQRNVEIQRLEEQVSNLESEIVDCEGRNSNLFQEQSSKQQNINILRVEINDYNQKKNIRLKEHSQLINSKKNRQYSFGEHTPTILQEIQQNRINFKRLPKGPIGMDIEVRDPKWTSAVETCIKPHMLRSFCVDNPQDSMVLTRILQKYYTDRMPSVIVSPFLPHMHDVSQHRAVSNFPTVLDMLIINDPVIANCLIDQLSIENVILIEDITTAQNIMLDNPPARCYSCYLLNCDEILLNPYRYYSASRKPANVLAKTIDDNYVQKLLQEINVLDANIHAKEIEMAEMRLQLQSYPAEIKSLGSRLVDLSTLRTRALKTIEELKQFETPRNVPEMQDEFLSLKNDLEKKQKELDEANERLTLHTEKSKEASMKKDQQRKIVDDLKKSYEEIGSFINDCGKNKEILAVSKVKFEQELKENERLLQQLEHEIEKDHKELKVTVDERQKVDKKPRVHTNRSHEEIDLQIKEMDKVIKEQSNSSDKTSLFEKYAEKVKRLHDAKLEYKQIETYNKQIAKMMARRGKKTREIIKYTQFVLNLSFSVFLKANGFTGCLNFSKPNALQLEATPKQDNPETGGKKSTSSLSGGERSFVTIAFLIALWEKILMPFRILDEYDVFMDSNNRHLSINLLLKHANEMKGTQYIFLSPLDLPELKETSASIKVHKMLPPERTGLSNMGDD